MQTKVFAPECTPWSQASTTADPGKKASNHTADLPALKWIASECEATNLDGADYIVENAAKSAIWDEPPLRELQQDPRMYSNVYDQCQHGAQGTDGAPIQNAPSSWHHSG